MSYFSVSNYSRYIDEPKGDLYFGFGGVAVDLQKPGTIMVAALNSWWPDGQIFRSTDSGASWTALWEWEAYPTMNRYYMYDDTLAPWLGPNVDETVLGTLVCLFDQLFHLSLTDIWAAANWMDDGIPRHRSVRLESLVIRHWFDNLRRPRLAKVGYYAKHHSQVAR